MNSKIAIIMKALGDDTRIEIFEMLKKNGSLCACKILEKFNISQPTLSHHMKILCDSGIIRADKDGKWTHYSINCSLLEELTDFLKETKCNKGKNICE